MGEPFLQIQKRHHMHRMQKLFRRPITRRNEALTGLKKIRFKICAPHHGGFYTLGKAKISEHCCTSLVPSFYLFSILPSFLHHGVRRLGGQGAGEAWFEAMLSKPPWFSTKSLRFILMWARFLGLAYYMYNLNK